MILIYKVLSLMFIVIISSSNCVKYNCTFYFIDEEIAQVLLGKVPKVTQL